jgi:hypothetical protein
VDGALRISDSQYEHKREILTEPDYYQRNSVESTSWQMGGNTQ